MHERIRRPAASLLLGFFCLAGAGLPVFAQVAPQQVNFQGLLLDSSGVPVNGLVDMSFTLYDAATGGTSLWTETHVDVDVIDGVYNLALGSTAPMSPALLAGGNVHLEVEVDGETLSPRQQFLSVPYALHAATAESAASAVTAQVADSVTVGTTEITLVIDSDNSGSGPAEGAGIVIDGGSGTDAGITWNADAGRWKLSHGIELPEVVPDLDSQAIVWPVSVGPSGGPYAESLFGINVKSSTGSGNWNELDNVFRLCYN